MVAHTLGPWFPALDNIGSPKVVAGKVDIARMSWLGFTMGDWQVGGDAAEAKRQEIAANARLVATAPELLSALKAMNIECLFDHLNPCWDNRPSDKPGLHWGSEEGAPIEACSACNARAAIAKAEGLTCP